MSEFIIRPETREDKSTIATLIARTYLAAGVQTIEAAGTLRNMPEHNNKLSLVAEESGKVKAFAMYSPVKIGDDAKSAVLLAPLAVDTKDEKFELLKFLEQTFKNVEDEGVSYILMHGEVQDHKEQGFVEAKSIGIKDDAEYEEITLLAKQLNKNKKLSGKVIYPECLK